jgi:hypothetical protein
VSESRIRRVEYGEEAMKGPDIWPGAARSRVMRASGLARDAGGQPRVGSVAALEKGRGAAQGRAYRATPPHTNQGLALVDTRTSKYA